MKKFLISFLSIILLTSCTDKIDDRGFYIEGKNAGINKITKSEYDKEGYNINGYNKYGFDRSGMTKKDTTLLVMIKMELTDVVMMKKEFIIMNTDLIR